MKPTVYIHTNTQQFLGALISRYSLKANSRDPDAFDVEIINLDDYPELYNKEGRIYKRKGQQATWKNSDLQSFSPLRFLPPQLMQYHGRALVIDPDVFAVGDVMELLTTDMEDKAILCRKISKQHAIDADKISPDEHKKRKDLASFYVYATSVMLLDCEKLEHWNWIENIEKMFSGQLDYGDWIYLNNEASDTIGELPPEWNHFDTLDNSTKLVHMTRRITQPWKTGLEIDFNTTVQKSDKKQDGNRFVRMLRNLMGKNGADMPCEQGYSHYQPHPDKKQEKFIIHLVKKAMESGDITREYLEEAIRMKYVRKDILDLVSG